MKLPFRREEDPSFLDPKTEQIFIQQTLNSKELLQKELNVTQAETALLMQRVQLMKSYLGQLPSSDPQYTLLVHQIHMDQIEIDELKVRETKIIDKIKSQLT